MFREVQKKASTDGFTQPMDVDSFRARQFADQQRYASTDTVVKRRPFHERYQHLVAAAEEDESAAEHDSSDSNEDGEDRERQSQDTIVDEGEEA